MINQKATEPRHCRTARFYLRVDMPIMYPLAYPLITTRIVELGMLDHALSIIFGCLLVAAFDAVILYPEPV